MDAQVSTRNFGLTGLRVTPLCIGTSSWGARPEGDDSVAGVAAAFASGSLKVNFLDTSNEYGGARSESLIGAALREAGGLGAGLVLQTKLDRDVTTGEFGGDRMWRSIEESLDRLGLDSVQVLYLHDPEHVGFDAAMAPGGAVEALVSMKEQGLASAIGISGGPVSMMQRFVETDAFDALVTHNRFTLLDRSADALFDASTKRGLGITNAAPYGAGVLTGDRRFAGSYGYAPMTAEVAAGHERVRLACEAAGVPLAAAALQFSMRDARIHSTIVGLSSRARLDAAIADAAMDIPPALWDELASIRPLGSMLTP